MNIDDTTHIQAFGTDYGTVVDILERDGFPVELGHLPYRVDTGQVLARVDTKLTARHQLALRFNWADRLDENVERWGGQIARSRGASLDSRDLMGAAMMTSVFSSRAVNELRFQIADHHQNVVSFDPKCSGVCDVENEGGPTLEVGAIAVGRQRFTPQPRTDVRYQLVDTFTRQAGRHQLKAGFDFSYIDQRLQKLPLHFGGRYVFQALTASQAASVGLPGPVDDALQALALGVPNSYLQGYGNSAVSGPYSDISLFAQDEWRVANRVTLKLGVRYQNQFWPQMTENVPGLPPYGWPSDNNNVAPRVGVSWEPLGDRKTLVRGTYGVSYNNLITSLWGLAAGISGTPDHVETLSLRRTDAYKGMADGRPEVAGAGGRVLELRVFHPAWVEHAVCPPSVGGAGPRARQRPDGVGEPRVRARLQPGREHRLPHRHRKLAPIHRMGRVVVPRAHARAQETICRPV